jgi:carboxymethylenebutenolidase
MAGSHARASAIAARTPGVPVCGQKKQQRGKTAMIERQLDIATRDGETTTFIVYPDRGGPFPVIVFLMDAPAIREELRDMARRFATSGYYVMLPNLYYRSGEMELGPIKADPEDPWRKKMFALMNTLEIPMVLSDVDAMIAFADADPAANAKSVGTIGYCMSGRFAVCAGGSRPDRVKATASIYGVKLVTDEETSPHLVAKRAPAEFYFACAARDHWAPQEMVDQMMRDLAGAHGEVEQYPETDHGFAFPQRPAYSKLAAEQHWQRVLALFARNLK